MTKRPLGLTLFGILFILSGVIDGLDSGWKLSRVSQKIQTVQAEQQRDLRSGPRHLGLALILDLMILIQGVGVLRLRQWAYWLTLLYTTIQVLIFMTFLMVLMPTAKTYLVPQWWVGPLIPLSRCGLILWYFTRPAVKAQFQRGGRSSAFHS